MNLIERLKKFVMLPSVVDLGWSKTNALPIRRFQPDVEGYTWEDYHQLMKNEYPVRNFIFHTLRQFLVVNVVMPLEHLKWYVRDVLFKKTHLLDLRQSSWVLGCDDFTGGYLDPCQQMLYACMNTLERFIVESDAKNHLEFLRSTLSKCEPESPEIPVLEDNIRLYEEALAIYKWWNVERKSDFLHLGKTDDYSTPETRKETLSRWDAFEEKEEEMMLRLVKIRRGLWN